MRMPIAHCLAWPAREPRCPARGLDLAQARHASPSSGRTSTGSRRCKLAATALDAGGWATNILNAANEIAVAAFLAGTIGFLEIATMVEETIERAAAPGLDQSPTTIKDALALDREGRRIATRAC